MHFASFGIPASSLESLEDASICSVMINGNKARLAAKGLTPTFFPHFLPPTASSGHGSAGVTTYNQRCNFNVFSRKPKYAKGFRFCSGAKD
jgi:hypothetical protein